MTRVLAFRREAVLTVLALTGIALLAPMLLKQQLITGTVVNAALIAATLWGGLVGGLLVGILPSTIALAAGTLPAPLMPMVPFIIIANWLLVLTVALVSRWDYWVGVAAAAAVKYAFLYAASTVVLSLLLDKGLPPAVAGMMGWPQLLTAALGGVAAFGLLKFLKPASR